MHECCVNDGFFYLADHGIRPSLIADALDTARQFFALPLSTKNQFCQDRQVVIPKTCRGYVDTFGKTLHPPLARIESSISTWARKRRPATCRLPGRTCCPARARPPILPSPCSLCNKKYWAG
ncbi:2-oxoglutarate and iron-dependent oxygenase domain-containing protein [Pseudomonas syringae pv. maculicola]|nr:2-oxoglutarate and iron-dependent oxygenase domain-containing protein [Pseudomonas syringae pv. maculicola]